MSELLAQLRAAPAWVKVLLAVLAVGVVVTIIAVATNPPRTTKVATKQTTTMGEHDDTETLPPGTLPPTTIPSAGTVASPAAPQTASVPSCRPNPLANVYHPYRLQVLSACTTVTGTVQLVRHEADGDFHFDLALDPPDAAMVNQDNARYQHGYLVAEIVPADESGCTPGQPPRPPSGTYDYGICTGADVPVPTVGAHVAVTGPYVTDHDHGWMEIHPVWSIGPAAWATPPATAVAAPSAAPPAAGASPTCSARMSDATPAPGAQETVFVASDLPTAAVSIAVHYKSTTHPYSTTTDGSGNASDTFGTGRPAAGHTVTVDVDVAGGAQCETGFTPQ